MSLLAMTRKRRQMYIRKKFWKGWDPGRKPKMKVMFSSRNKILALHSCSLPLGKICISSDTSGIEESLSKNLAKDMKKEKKQKNWVRGYQHKIEYAVSLSKKNFQESC